MKIGIQMYTLRKSMTTPEDFDKTLRRVAEIGYKSVQITPPGFVTAKDLAAQLKTYGLSADSVIRTVMSIPEQLDQICADAEFLQTDVLRTDSIPNEWRSSADGYRKFAQHLEHCGKLLHQHGLKFMYHFHAFEYTTFGQTRGIDILLNETSPEYVMFQPDVFWMTAAGTEPSAELLRYRGRTTYMHLKDYLVTPSREGVLEEYSHVSAPVGTGNLNWAGILSTARSIGVENFVVEDDMGILDPFDSAAQSFSNLTRLF